MRTSDSKSNKAERIQSLDENIGDLRQKVREDLKSDDEQTRLTALAVALIDRTFARVGNETSTENGVYGVTGWRCEHVSFHGDEARIEYVGKSEVEQSKTIDTKYVVEALKLACEDNEGYILTWEENGKERKLKAPQVNNYLSEFGITSKDIRGYHANDEMRSALKRRRSEGKALPEDADERESVLRNEFLDALDEVSELLGHQASTLRRNYLVDGLEESYIDNAEVVTDFEKASKNASLARRLSSRLASSSPLSRR